MLYAQRKNRKELLCSYNFHEETEHQNALNQPITYKMNSRWGPLAQLHNFYLLQREMGKTLGTATGQTHGKQGGGGIYVVLA